MKYHNSPNGPRKCEAEKRGCNYAMAGMPHFETQAEAQSYYDESMKSQFGAFETMKITRGEKLRQTSYKTEDAIVAKIEKVQATVAQAKATVVMGALNAKHQASMLRDNATSKGKSLISRIGAKIEKIKADSIQYAAQLEAMELSNKEALRQAKIDRLMERSEKLSAKAEALSNGTYVSPLKQNIGKAKAETVAAAQRAVRSSRRAYSNGARKLGEFEITRTKMASQLQRGDRISNGVVLSANTVDGKSKVVYMNNQGVILSARFDDAPVQTRKTVKSYSRQVRKAVTKAPKQMKQSVVALTAGIQNSYHSKAKPFKAAFNVFNAERKPSVAKATQKQSSNVSQLLTIEEFSKMMNNSEAKEKVYA